MKELIDFIKTKIYVSRKFDQITNQTLTKITHFYYLLSSVAKRDQLLHSTKREGGLHFLKNDNFIAFLGVSHHFGKKHPKIPKVLNSQGSQKCKTPN